MSGSVQDKTVIDLPPDPEGDPTSGSPSLDSALRAVLHSSAGLSRESELHASGYTERAYSFWAYFRSRFGFALGMAAMMAVVAGILAVTGSNGSAIALVSLCEALFACIVLAVGFLRDREFYQQLDLFCNSARKRAVSLFAFGRAENFGRLHHLPRARCAGQSRLRRASRPISRHEGVPQLYRAVGPRG